MRDKTLYLAGGLFNTAERMHNAYLEKHLQFLGFETVLPQRRAEEFFHEGKFDLQALVQDCQKFATDDDCIFVGCIDGADADSGTAVEYGMAIAATSRAILYRTDFRTEMSKELGINGMLTAKGTEIIYSPCFVVEKADFDAFYALLAQKIADVIKKM